MSIPPIGRANLMIPITVPDISIYVRPARVMMSGSSDETVMPARYMRIYVIIPALIK